MKKFVEHASLFIAWNKS